MTNNEKIEAILQRGLDNFMAGKPFPEDVLAQGIFDTLNEIDEVDPVIGTLMHDLMNHECSSCDDDMPLTDAEYNNAVEHWLKHMLNTVKSNSTEV